VRFEDNPADLSSRGIEVDEKEKWKFYHKGPPFLTWPQGLWPAAKVDSALTDEEEVEVRKVKECASAEINAEPSVLDKLSQNCSDWQRLVRRVASLARFKQFLINKYQDLIHSNVSMDPLEKGLIHLSEFQRAKKDIAAMLQKQSFTETIGCLEDQPTNFRLKASLEELLDAQAFREKKKTIKATLNKMGGPLLSLDPILYEGQLRVGGQIG
jgi:hypothetical protein